VVAVKRAFAYVFVVVLVLAGLLWPVVAALLGPLDSSAPSDPVVVTRYEASYTVAADGNLVAVEDITAEFPSGRHGIFRYWDVADPSNPRVRYVPTLGSITMDGGNVPYETYWDSGNRFLVAKIGDPDSTLARGLHTYRITYSVPGAIAPPTAGTGTFVSTDGTNDGPPQSVFYWNVVAQGWEMRMRDVLVRITLPSPAGEVQCTAGAWAGGSDPDGQGPCAITGAGTTQVTLAASDLPPRSGMTVRAGLTTPPPPQVTVPWPVALDQVLGTSVQRVIAVLAFSLAGLILGFAWSRGAKETPPGFPVMYAPPQGLGPVQTVYIDTEDAGSHALVASVLYMADRGLVTLEQRVDDSWLVTGRATTDQWAMVDQVTRSVGEALGVIGPGFWFLADKSKEAGAVLQTAAGRAGSAASSWASGAGYIRPSRNERWGRLVWLICAVLAVVGFLTWLTDLTMYGLPFAAFVLGGLGLMTKGVGTRRTSTGRVVWSQAGGFERLLSTPSAEDRFDYSARKDLFISYVPYAVAFGVADKWAKKYRTATGQEPPVPTWYPYGVGYGSLYSSGGGFDSFERSVSASIGAYQASQRSSSSSGGGGGSFGGGGGGGGGGSW
jgi:hypothetical protein